MCGYYSYTTGQPPEAIIKDDYVRTPSDHMCVVADFEFLKEVIKTDVEESQLEPIVNE